MTVEREILEKLLKIPTVSGHESEYAPKIAEALSVYFDGISIDRVGNITVLKRAKKPNAKKLLIDAHIDQIGFLVSKIEDGGFLRVASVGGIDARTLPSSDVLVCSDTPFFAVISSTPPHLSDSDGKLTGASEILIDTGFSSDELKSRVRIGDAVVFAGVPADLAFGAICSPALDNKLCAAAALAALYEAECEYDTCVLLSVREESGGFVGARVGIAEIKPDMAIVCDVNFARAYGVEKRESIERGKGPSVSISALTDKSLTNEIISLAKQKEILLQTVVEASNLGSNANVAAITAEGVRTAAISLPITNMHSTSECASLSDLCEMKRLLAEIMGGKI